MWDTTSERVVQNSVSSFPRVPLLPPPNLALWFSLVQETSLFITSSSNYNFNKIMTLALTRSKESLVDYNFKMGGGAGNSLKNHKTFLSNHVI